MQCDDFDHTPAQPLHHPQGKESGRWRKVNVETIITNDSSPRPPSANELANSFNMTMCSLSVSAVMSQCPFHAPDNQ